VAEAVIEYGLVGEKLGHSFSPEIHARLGDYKYELIEVPRDDIDEFFYEKQFAGLNVTIPYKETVIGHLDGIDEAAMAIGAVNTVVVRDGFLFGYNTDFLGMRDAMLRVGIDAKDKKVLILGSGGTSKTAKYVAGAMGASSVFCVSRKARERYITYEDAVRDHSDADIIINTTPSGMYPDVDGCPIDISAFENLSGVFDAVFNPLRTNLVLTAESRNIPAAGGLYMLVSQAAHASEIFTEKEVPAETIEEIYKKLKEEKENIVLSGMPSSGKTSVGKLLAEKLEREFFDTDALICEMEGMEIPEIFERFGETYFRDAESRAVKVLSEKTGAVIATGGGAILRAENVNALKRSGRIYFLDRPLSKLITTDDRPLSSDRKSLETRYAERIDIYRSTADVIIDGDGTVEETAEKVLEELRIVK